jgi:tyrosine-protein phosphatase SIW14
MIMSKFVRLRCVLLMTAVATLVGCAGRHDATRPTPKEIAAAEKREVAGIKDFGKITEFMYRGAQPTTEGIDELKKLGIGTIVDLRGERRGLMKKERAHAEELGMRLVNIPGYGWASPKDEQVAEFFALVNEKPRRKMFLHCWLGGDRDGLFIAAYRIAFDGWTAEQALQEMRAFHFNEFWHPNMRTWVEKFPERLAKSAELAPYRNREKRDEKMVGGRSGSSGER